MSALDDVISANRFCPAPTARSAPPVRHLAVLTCMDARIDPLALFGLQPGDAHVIRNAGGIPTDDALRSLAISQRALGTREVAVIHHTRCGMDGFDDTAFRAELAEETGSAPTWDVPGFSDLMADAARSAQTVRDCPWLTHREQIRGFVLDVETGRLSEAG